MPVIDFTQEFAPKKTNFQFPKLKLEMKEKARINIGLSPVEMEYVHNLEKPVIEDGVPVYEERERKDGKKYTAVKREWVGSPVSLGDFSKLSDKGIDPDNCPISAFHVKHPEWVSPPKPKYAMNIIRYRTKPGTFNILDPFSVEALVWTFGPAKFESLMDLKAEWDKLGGFKDHDLYLGPVTSKAFQNFDINVSPEAVWQNNEDYKKMTLETFELNKVEDLSAAIGRKKDESRLAMDLTEIEEAWKQVMAYEARQKNSKSYDLGTASGALDDDLNGLLSNDTSVDETSAPSADEPEASTFVPEETQDEDDANNFDDLLKGL